MKRKKRILGNSFKMYFVVVVSILVASPWLLKFYYDYKDSKLGLLGPPTVPIFGNFLQLIKSIRDGHAYLEFLKINQRYGETFRIRLFNIFIVFTSNVKMIELIANNPRFGKADEYRFYKQWMGDSTLLASGERWSKLRKLVSPAFHFQILEGFVSVFEEQADQLVKTIKKVSVETPIDVIPYFAAYALNVVNESAMGIKAEIQGNSSTQKLYTEAVVEILQIIDKRLLNPLYHYDWIWKFTPSHQREQELVKIIHSFVDNLIEMRRVKLIKKLSVFGNSSNRRKFALLDTLLQSTMDGQPLTNEDIRGEVNTFIFAGHDTTTSLSALLFYRIALHEDVQQKIYEEIHDKILDLKMKKITISALNNLTYLDLCIKECLRLYLPVPIVGKKGKDEVKLGNITIPANTTIYVMMHANHLNPKYFPSPTEFLPERFHGEISANDRHPYSYTPFSAGIRNCVGQRFAILDMKMLTVKLLTAFSIELAHKDFKPDLYCRGLMKCANGMHLRFIPREKQ